MASRRPEHVAPPEIFYSIDEARKYTGNSRMAKIQMEMSERAIELLALPEDEPRFILDLGCGSGISGEALENQGHYWIGVDISKAMLDVATEKKDEGDIVLGDTILGDLGHGLCFRAGMFDGAISISALQWLCNADKRHHSPPKRLYNFFTSLYSCLARGSRAVFQFYPENSNQVELITQQAMKAGFGGGLVVDFPNSTKAKKMFLVLFTGGPQKLPAALGTEETGKDHVQYTKTKIKGKVARGKSVKSTREWIMEKKERRRKQGHEVHANSKYTGRKRSKKF